MDSYSVCFLPVDEFMGLSASRVSSSGKRRCGRHMTAAIEQAYSGFFAFNVAYRDPHTSELCLVQILPNAPPGFLCVIHRQFASRRHQEFMSELARTVRLQCLEWTQDLVMGCRDCCLCPALQLFELMAPGVTMARETVETAMAEAVRLGDVGAESVDSELIASAQFALAPLATQRAALLWFFGGVYDPLTTFWRCVEDAHQRHGVAGVPKSVAAAVCQVQDEALRLWILATTTNDDVSAAHYQSIRDGRVCFMLQAGRLYVHSKHK